MLTFLFGFSLAINIFLIALLLINRKTNKIFSNLKQIDDFDLFDTFYSGDSIENSDEDRKEDKLYE